MRLNEESERYFNRGEKRVSSHLSYAILLRPRSYSDRDPTQTAILLRLRSYSDRDPTQAAILLRPRSYSDRVAQVVERDASNIKVVSSILTAVKVFFTFPVERHSLISSI